MGILNVTPDSFADGGRRFDPARAVEAGLRMVDGRRRHHRRRRRIDTSRRRGARRRGRAAPRAAGHRALSPARGALVSIDTYKAIGRARGHRAGAAIVNDVSGLQYDAGLARVVAESRRGGRPDAHARALARHVSRRPSTTNVVEEVRRRARSGVMARAEAAGGRAIGRSILDPGLRLRQEGGAQLDRCWRGSMRSRALDRPILSGPSRKSFLQRGDRRARRRRARVGHGRGGRPRACCSARTSCACTACARWSTSCASRTGSQVRATD